MTLQQRAYRQMKQKRIDSDYAELESVQGAINDLVVSINASSQVVYCRKTGDQLRELARCIGMVRQDELVPAFDMIEKYYNGSDE